MMQTKTITQDRELTLSGTKGTYKQVYEIASSSSKTFADAPTSLADPKFIQTLLDNKTWCFVSPEGFLELFANKEQKEGRYHIVKDQNGNLRELDFIETEDENEKIYIYESAFQRAKKGEPLALGRGCIDIRDGRLVLFGYYSGGFVAWVALASQAEKASHNAAVNALDRETSQLRRLKEEKLKSAEEKSAQADALQKEAIALKDEADELEKEITKRDKAIKILRTEE